MSEGERALSEIGAEMRDRLRHVGFDAGESYLTGVQRIVSPLQEQIDQGRDRLWDLMEQARDADDAGELGLINERATALAGDLFVSLHSVPMVQEICTRVRDAIAERALELARRKLYFSGTFCQRRLTLFSVGSDGRKEQSLYADQDYLFLYDGSGLESERDEEALDEYFGRLGSVFMTQLELAGIERCSGGIMPVNEEWRGTPQQWRDRLATTFRFERQEYQKNILNLIALMDARYVCGSRKLGGAFAAEVRTLTRDEPEALRQMARVASAMKLPKGFLRWFSVEAEGAHKGEFNLKVLAWTPLVMCVRLLAVYFGIEETATLERIRLLRDVGCLTEKLAADLVEAFHLLSGLRIMQQVKRRKRIIDHDSYLNPYELPTDQREALHKALNSIEAVQSLIRIRFWVNKDLEIKTILRR